MTRRTSQTSRFPTTLFSIALGLGALLLLASGCGSDIARVGVVVPETGDYQSYGQALKKGIEVAVEQLRAEPQGAKIEIEIVDSKSDPDEAAQALNQVFDNGAQIAIGGVTSGEALRMIEVVDGRGRVLVSPSASSPELTGISSNFYRTYPSDLLEANKMAMFTAETLKTKSLVIWAQQDIYGAGIDSAFRQEFEKLGGKVDGDTFPLPQTASELSGIAESIRDVDPAAVYIAGYDSNVADAIHALRKVHFKGRILTTSAFATPAGIEGAGDDADGVLLTQIVFDVDSEHAHVQSFVARFRKTFGEKPDLYAALGYDAMMVVAAAVKDRPLLHGEILKGMRGIKEFPGVTGSIQFDERGDVKKFPRVYQISQGALVNYDELIRLKREEVARQRRVLQERLLKLHQEGGN